MNSLEQLQESRSSIRAIFIDDGGVLNDNRLRGPEYLRLIGEFMSARLGGAAQQWAEANKSVFPSLWAELNSRIMDFPSHKEFQCEYELLWIRGMCSLVGVPTPPTDHAAAIAREAAIYIGKHARTEIEGAANAVWKLFRAGYTLYTASGTPSWELKEIFTRMGIFEAFNGLYGPDTVDHVKYGAEFYRRIISGSSFLPSECLVIESSKKCCNWAIEAGAQAVWVDYDQIEAIDFTEVVETFL